MIQNTAVMTVSELNEYTRLLLAADPVLRSVEVTGEISGYKHHYSGHRYFTLKDADSRIQCVMFRQYAQGLTFAPADGQKVIVSGSVALYVRDGSYQLYVHAMRPAGQGDLYAKFEALKARLLKEGLFDESLKRPIPFYPRTIGIVTALTGAAVHDMIRVARRRNPNVGIVIAPCAVQGAGAAQEIARAIERLNRQGACDVLLVGRGGGSIEDLWAFNEEVTARAIRASKIPVISCVGHEVDFTIADFAADARAATPSAAAEIAVPVYDDLVSELSALTQRLHKALRTGQTIRRQRLQAIADRPVLRAPAQHLLKPLNETLQSLRGQLDGAMTRRRDAARAELFAIGEKLSALNPRSVLGRGYAYVTRGDAFVRRAGEVQAGEHIDVIMTDGRIEAQVCAVTAEGETYAQKETDV